MREFIHIENIEAFRESIRIALACNKLLRKRFFRPDTIGLNRSGGTLVKQVQQYGFDTAAAYDAH